MDKLSVIIPSIGKRSLNLCLKSLEQQSLIPNEILIVDNTINKNAYKVFSNFRGKNGTKIRYIWEKKKGVSFARNRGIKEALNDTLCFIDDDCTADKNWLKELNKCFLENKKKVIIRGENKNGNIKNIFSCAEYFNDEIFFKKNFFIDKKQVISFWLDSKNFILSKKIIKKNRLAFRNYQMGEDLDFSLQAKLKKIPILYCPEAKITHYGRTDIFNHLIREVKKGREAVKLTKQWDLKNDPNFKKILFNKQYFWKPWINEKKIKKELYKTITNSQKLSFKTFFYLLVGLDKAVNYLFFILN